MAITLASPFVAQAAFQSDQVVVVQNDDRPIDGTLKSLVELGGNPSCRYWVPVYSGEDYNPNWTDAEVAAAVQAWFAAEAA